MQRSRLMEPHLGVGLLFLCFACITDAASLGGVSIAYCRNTSTGRWRQKIGELLIEFPFRVDPVDCGDISNSNMAIVIRDNTGMKDVVFRTKDQSAEQFFASVLRKISPRRLSTAGKSHKDLEESLASSKEAIVAFVKEDTTEDFIFQQALVTPYLPKSIKVFKIIKMENLTPLMKQDVHTNLHIWIVTDHGKDQNHVPLPYSSTDEHMKLFLIALFKRMKLPSRLKYESNLAYPLPYQGAGFNFFTVYHHSEQEEEVNKTIIDPLVNIFRPFYVFVSVNIDKYKLPDTVPSNTPLPLVVVTKYNQRIGLPISSLDTPYTTENFKKILGKMADPENDVELDDESLFGGISFPDKVDIPSSLPMLTTETYENFVNQHQSCLIAFYLYYTSSSKTLLMHLINTTEILQTTGMSAAVVNCGKYPDVCQKFDVHVFPTVKYRIAGEDKWNNFDGIVSDIELLKLAQGTSSDVNEKSTKNSIIELTPLQLRELLINDNTLITLVLLVAENITPELEVTLSDHNNIYWLNSTRYAKLADFFIGLSLSPPPVLVIADYEKNSLYRLDLKKPVTKQDLSEFFVDVSRGNRQPEGDITPAKWKPVSPAIHFPSNRLLATLEHVSSTNNDGSNSSNGSGEHELTLLEQQPLYADPNRYASKKPTHMGADPQDKQQQQGRPQHISHKEL